MENVVIEIDAIPGESTLAMSKTGIELFSFSHGVAMGISASNSGVGRTFGRAVHQDMTIAKRLDKTSPTLNFYCSAGKTIKSAVIRVFAAADDGKPVEYYNIKMTDLILTSVAVGGGGSDRPTESISFNYNEITWTYVAHDHDKGAAAGNVATSWNLQKNTSK